MLSEVAGIPIGSQGPFCVCVLFVCFLFDIIYAEGLAVQIAEKFCGFVFVSVISNNIRNICMYVCMCY